MTAIPPSLPNPSAAASPQGSTVATVAMGSVVPASLSGLDAESLVTATVLAQGRGTVDVALAGSPETVTLRLAFPVLPGAELLFQVVSAGTSPQLRVLAINGQPVKGGALRAETPPPASVPAAASGGASALPSALAALSDSSAGIAATLVRPNPAADQSALPVGTTLTVRIAALTPPPSGPAVQVEPPNVAPAPGSGQPATPPSPVASSPPAGTGQAALPASDLEAEPMPLPGGNGNLNGQAAPPPAGSQSPSSAPPPSPAGTGTPSVAAGSSPPIPPSPSLAAALPSSLMGPPDVPAGENVPANLDGVVVANANGSQTLVQTSLGYLSLNVATPLAPGTQVVLDLVGQPVPPAAGTGHQDERTQASSLPALAAALEVLKATQLPLLARLPQEGASFMPALFVCLAATAKGGLWRWLGEETAEALKTVGRHDLAAALRTELAPAIPQTPVGPDEWQAFVVPFLMEGQVQRLRLVTRRRSDEADARARRDREGARFLVDVDLSHTGAMQLDGLLKRVDKRFDLIVRTHRALPREMQNEIKGIFVRSLDGLGYCGEALFQQASRFVDPLPPGRRAALSI